MIHGRAGECRGLDKGREGKERDGDGEGGMREGKWEERKGE